MKHVPFISLIIIVNNKEIYKEFLEQLNNQLHISYELLEIDNCKGEYSSARSAYNFVAQNAKGEYLFFLHPDIRFLSKTSLHDMMKYITKMIDFGVVGVAGCTDRCEHGKRIIVSNIVHGKDKVKAGRHVNSPVIVQTVDECMFVIQKEKFIKTPFSSKDGWHLYAVEQCLQYSKNGLMNYVIPADIWHLSDGKSLDYHYVLQLKSIIREFKDRNKIICTTVKKWRTDKIYVMFYINYYAAKQFVKVILKKIIK